MGFVGWNLVLEKPLVRLRSFPAKGPGVFRPKIHWCFLYVGFPLKSPQCFLPGVSPIWQARGFPIKVKLRGTNKTAGLPVAVANCRKEALATETGAPLPKKSPHPTSFKLGCVAPYPEKGVNLRRPVAMGKSHPSFV